MTERNIRTKWKANEANSKATKREIKIKIKKSGGFGDYGGSDNNSDKEENKDNKNNNNNKDSNDNKDDNKIKILRYI